MSRRWLGPTALAAVALVMTFGFCVLPGHHGDLGNHGTSPELCASLTLAMIAVATVLPLPGPTGRLVAEGRLLLSPLQTPVPHRPPELAILSF